MEVGVYALEEGKHFRCRREKVVNERWTVVGVLRPREWVVKDE